MCKQLCLFLLLVVLEYSGKVSGECVLNTTYIEHSYGTFVKSFEGLKFAFMIDRIEDGGVVEVYCHNDGNKFEKHNITCKSGQLFPKDPIKCIKPANATVIPSPQRNALCPAKLYQVGIQIEKEFLEYYSVCYDKENFRTYFSQTVTLWRSIQPQIPITFYTTDGLLTTPQANSYRPKKIYEAFKKIFGNNQTYVKKHKSGSSGFIVRGQLTPAEDLLFPDQTRSTLKYVNVLPQFTSIYNTNWYKIEQWTYNKMLPYNISEFTTGGLGVLSLPDFTSTRTMKPVYLIPEKKQNPVPEWTYKMMAHPKQQYVFITYNNIFADKKPAAHKCCKTIECPLRLKDSAIFGYTYCCEPKEFYMCLLKRK